jgi:shikimate kinase
MAVVLVTGMSGAGKSTVLGELARCGHTAVDTDHGDHVQAGGVAGFPDAEPLWREARIRALLDAHSGDGHLFIAGTVANQGRFYSRFDAVVLLTAPLAVLLDRVATRTTNAFGKDPAERAAIARDVAEVEPLLRRGATVEIDTRRPLADVVAAVLAAADRRT